MTYMIKLTYKNLFIAFCILTGLDYIFTISVLNLGGMEANPLSAFAFESTNPILYGFMYKLATIILVYSIYKYFIIKRKTDSLRRILMVVNIALSIAVINNIFWSLYL